MEVYFKNIDIVLPLKVVIHMIQEKHLSVTNIPVIQIVQDFFHNACTHPGSCDRLRWPHNTVLLWLVRQVV